LAGNLRGTKAHISNKYAVAVIGDIPCLTGRRDSCLQVQVAETVLFFKVKRRFFNSKLNLV
jgi:hypothetical protein